MMSFAELMEMLPMAAALMYAGKKINQILWDWNHPEQEQTHENTNG